jgi:hypothetical protein
MTVTPSIDPARMLEEQLAQASPDVRRELLGTFINTLLSADADAVCGAAYGTSSPERVNQRNGYRHRVHSGETSTPRGHPGRGDPQDADRFLLPRVAARTPDPGRAG